MSHDTPDFHVDGPASPEPVAETSTSPRPQTGHARVDAATELLVGLDGRPTSEHAPVFEEVHQRLHGALADLDDE